MKAWLAGLLLIVVTLLVAPPDFRQLIHWQPTWYERALDWKIQHPLSAIPTDQFVEPNYPYADGIVSHLHKRDFRVLIPVVAHGLKMDMRGTEILNVLFSLAFLVVMLLYLRREVPDHPVITLLLTISFACSFAGEWGVVFPGTWEPVAYLLLALAVYVENPYLIFGCVALGALQDERFVMALPMVYLMQGESLLMLNRKRYAIAAGFAVFAALRVLLAMHVGHAYESSGVGLRLLFYNSLASPMYFVTVFKGALLVLLFGFVALFRRDRRRALSLLLCALPVIAAALATGDSSKGLIYLFPVFLLCALALCRDYQPKQVMQYAVIAAALSVCLPTYYYWQHGFAHFQNAWQRIAMSL